jgi:hypothetical protein
MVAHSYKGMSGWAGLLLGSRRVFGGPSTQLSDRRLPPTNNQQPITNQFWDTVVRGRNRREVPTALAPGSVKVEEG